jgi:hypothetical protein
MSDISKFARTCVHFNGFECGTCRAGVNYADVKQSGLLAMFGSEKFPCEGEVKTCEKFKSPTTDEVVHRSKLVDGGVVARKRIQASLQGLRGVGGSIPCPVCGRSLRYKSIPYTDILRFKCETPECLDVNDQ